MKLYTIIQAGKIIGCEDNLQAAEQACPKGADLRTVYVDSEHEVLAETRRLGWTWSEDTEDFGPVVAAFEPYPETSLPTNGMTKSQNDHTESLAALLEVLAVNMRRGVVEGVSATALAEQAARIAKHANALAEALAHVAANPAIAVCPYTGQVLGAPKGSPHYVE